MNAAPAPAEKYGTYAIFRNPDFARYLAGRLILMIGQQMVVVAVGWELYARTHSPIALGMVGLTEVLALGLFTLPAGHLADNHSRKSIILAATLATTVSNVGLALIFATRAPVDWIYCCLFITATAQTFSRPASTAFITGLVPRSILSHAVAWNSGTFQLASIAGPVAGGALIALTHHATVVFLVNFCAALLCFALLCFVRRERVVPNPEQMTRASLVTGFNFIFANRLVTGMIMLDVFAMLLGGAAALLPAIARDILHVGPDGLGLLQAAMPLGAFGCALGLAHRPPLRRAGRSLLWAVAVFGVATMFFGLSRCFWFSFALLAIAGAADNISIVVRHTSVQLFTPDEKRRRVSAVNSLFVVGASDSLGGFESGLVAHLCGPAIGNTIATGAMISVVTGGLGTVLVVGAVAGFWPEIRRYGRLDGS